MTTAPRVPRPARPLPPGRPHRRVVVPPATTRRKRGPKPPDAIIARVGAALERDLDDPAVQRPADRTHAALLLAAIALLQWARRGVTQALPPGPERDRAAEAVIEQPGAENWASTVVAAIAASVARSTVIRLPQSVVRQRAHGVLEEHLLREHSLLVQSIATAAGVPNYVWTTQGDERVRQLHVELEGTLQRWDDPPLAGEPDFHGHPGEAANCRCQATPILL